MEGIVNFDGVGELQLKNVEFIDSAKQFCLTAGDGHPCQFFVNYPYPKTAFTADHAIVLLLYNPNHAESDVKSIKIGQTKDTVGWLCTLDALISNNHAFVDNKHFRDAAFAGVHRILQHTTGFRKQSLQDGAVLDLSDLMSDDASVLILFKPAVDTFVSENCNELLPSLHQIGFVPFRPDIIDIWKPGAAAQERFRCVGAKVKLMPLSSSFGFGDFITQVLGELVPTATTELLHFFFYYQIIEGLLENVFAIHQAEILTEIMQHKENAVRIHPLIEKLIECSSEKKKITLLFSQYTGLEAELEVLRIACNDLILDFGGVEQQSSSKALYEVRNLIFHNLRKSSRTAMPKLRPVIDELQIAIPELLLQFQSKTVASSTISLSSSSRPSAPATPTSSPSQMTPAASDPAGAAKTGLTTTLPKQVRHPELRKLLYQFIDFIT